MTIDCALFVGGKSATPDGLPVLTGLTNSIRVDKPGSVLHSYSDLAYIAYLTLDPDECDQPSVANLVVTDPDGEISFRTFAAPTKPTIDEFDGHGKGEFWAPMHLILKVPGVYLAELHWNGVVVHTTRLHVRITPAA